MRFRPIRIPALTIVALLIAIMTMSAVVAATPRPESQCEIVSGTFTANIVLTGAGFDVYIVTTTGPLAGSPEGTRTAVLEIQRITPGGAIHFTGMHELQTTAFGLIKTDDNGVLTPSGHAVVRSEIVYGATGNVQFHTVANLETGQLTGWYHGRVCQS